MKISVVVLTLFLLLIDLGVASDDAKVSVRQWKDLNPIVAVIDDTFSQEKLKSSKRFFEQKLIDNNRFLIEKLQDAFVVTLESKGYNVEEILEEIQELKGSPSEMVEYINEILEGTVLKVNNDDAITINYKEFVVFLKKLLNAWVKIIYEDNLLARLTARAYIDQYINGHSAEVKQIIESFRISPENLVAPRQKRDLSDLWNDIVDQLLKTVIESTLNIFRGPISLILTPLQATINTTVSLASEVLSTFYTSEETNNLIQSILGHSANIIIDRAFDIIGFVQYFSDQYIGELVNGKIDNWIALIKSIFTNEETPAATRILLRTATTENSTDLETIEDNPLLEWIWSKVVIIANLGLKIYVSNIINAILPPLGPLLLEPLKESIFQTIDTVFPCGNCTLFTR